MNQRLGYRAGAGRWCTGRYRFADTVRVEAVACPGRAPAEQSGQCSRCAGQDDFRFAHHIHQGGHVPEALRRYVNQPHWLYLATFADGTTKVGTAAEPRKRSRLDEQGAIFATYLAKANDGRAVRHLEEALSHRIGVPQTVRAAAKLRALADMRDLSTARVAHERIVAHAAETLTDMNVTAALEAWVPPDEGERLRAPANERALYPHDPREGEHGFTALACIGSHILAAFSADESIAYLLDLGVLKGRRIVLGSFNSPGTAVQSPLF
jgi:hypothetical protein